MTCTVKKKKNFFWSVWITINDYESSRASSHINMLLLYLELKKKKISKKSSLSSYFSYMLVYIYI